MPANREFHPRLFAAGAAVLAFLAGARFQHLLFSRRSHDASALWEDAIITAVWALLAIGYLWRVWRFIPSSVPRPQKPVTPDEQSTLKLSDE